jgi:hypothetical protein
MGSEYRPCMHSQPIQNAREMQNIAGVDSTHKHTAYGLQTQTRHVAPSQTACETLKMARVGQSTQNARKNALGKHALHSESPPSAGNRLRTHIKHSECTQNGSETFRIGIEGRRNTQNAPRMEVKHSESGSKASETLRTYAKRSEWGLGMTSTGLRMIQKAHTHTLSESDSKDGEKLSHVHRKKHSQ